MLDNAARWMKPDVVYPNIRFSAAKSFFDDLEKKLPAMKVPIWSDELYLSITAACKPRRPKPRSVSARRKNCS